MISVRFMGYKSLSTCVRLKRHSVSSETNPKPKYKHFEIPITYHYLSTLSLFVGRHQEKGCKEAGKSSETSNGPVPSSWAASRRDCQARINPFPASLIWGYHNCMNLVQSCYCRCLAFVLLSHGQLAGCNRGQSRVSHTHIAAVKLTKLEAGWRQSPGNYPQFHYK